MITLAADPRKPAGPLSSSSRAGRNSSRRAAQSIVSAHRRARTLASADDWLSLVASAGLKGPVRELASHTAFLGYGDGRYRVQSRIEAPVLLIHGSADRLVPVTQSEGMADALKRAGKAHRFIRQEDGDQRDQVIAEVDHEKRFSSQNTKLFHWSSSRSR